MTIQTQTPPTFLIQRVWAGDFDYSEFATKNAAWQHEKTKQWVKGFYGTLEHAKNEFMNTLVEYTARELIELHLQNHSLPSELNLLDRIPLKCEIRDALNTGYGGDYFDVYVDNHQLQATTLLDAVAECEELQEKHDAAFVEANGEGEAYNHAPCYINHLYAKIVGGDDELIHLKM